MKRTSDDAWAERDSTSCLRLLRRLNLRMEAEVREARELEDELNAEGTSYAEVADEAMRDQELARRAQRVI